MKLEYDCFFASESRGNTLDSADLFPRNYAPAIGPADTNTIGKQFKSPSPDARAITEKHDRREEPDWKRDPIRRSDSISEDFRD